MRDAEIAICAIDTADEAIVSEHAIERCVIGTKLVNLENGRAEMPTAPPGEPSGAYSNTLE
jgi:hypothetical protein